MYKQQANSNENYQNQPVLLGFVAYFFMVDVCVWFWFYGAGTFSASKIVPSSCNVARSLVFHGVPPRVSWFPLRQWDEDGGKEGGRPGNGWDAPDSGLISDTPPPPHPRQSSPIDSGFVGCVSSSLLYCWRPCLTCSCFSLPPTCPSSLFSAAYQEDRSKTQTWSHHPLHKIL